MPRVRGMHGKRLDAATGRVERLLVRVLRGIASRVARLVGGSPSPAALSDDDLETIRRDWRDAVTVEILPAVGAVYAESAEALAKEFADAGRPVEVLSLEAPTAADFLDAANNRLVGVADTLWETARKELADGVRAGEGIEDLAARLQEAGGFGITRARTIARTEVVAAANAASLAQALRLGDSSMLKTWEDADDQRVRPAHAGADGQSVPLAEPFEVGGEWLMYPGQPIGSPSNVINERCTLVYDLAEPLTAAAEVQTGAMIALRPSVEDAARLAVPGGEPADELHCTLVYLGDAADVPPAVQQTIIDRLAALVEDAIRSDYDLPMVVDGFSVELFNPPGVAKVDGKQRDTCIVLGLSGGDLDPVHRMVVETVAEVFTDAGLRLPEQHNPWHPHTTLVYTDDANMVPNLVDRAGPVVFDAIRVAFGGENTNIPLAPISPPEVQVPAAAGDADEYLATRLTAFVAGDADLRAYWVRGEGAAKIRWGTDGDFDRCVRRLGKYVRDPEGLCAEYHREAVGKWPGEKANHAVLTDSATDRVGAGFADPGAIDATTDVFRDGEHWHAVANIEDVSTGWRKFTPGALTWREPPFAFHWQWRSSAHGGQPQTVHVGTVTRVERDPDNSNVIHMWGSVDLDGVEGREYGRRLASGVDRWVSIGLDESFRESDVEYVYPAGVTLDDADAVEVEPDELIISKGRIGELTAVSVPAQHEATIEASPELRAYYEAVVAAGQYEEHEHPRGVGGRWVRKTSGTPGVTTTVTTAGGDVEVDANDDGTVGLRTPASDAEAAEIAVNPGLGADLAATLRENLAEGDVVDVADGDASVGVTRAGDDYRLDIGADREAVLGPGDRVAVAEVLEEAAALAGGNSAGSEEPDTRAVAEARAGDLDLLAYDDGSVDITDTETGDGFGITVADAPAVADALEQIWNLPEAGRTFDISAAGLDFHVDEVGDVDVAWGPEGARGGMVLDPDHVFDLAQVLRDLHTELTEHAGDAAVTTSATGPRREVARRRVTRSEPSTVIVASGYTITIPNVPPAEWFGEPTDVTPHGALTITDEGRVYGYLAPAGVAHRSFRNRRVEVPMGNVDYSRWMGGEAIVAGGGRVVAGPITFECGHCDPAGPRDPGKRMEHYDNTCSVAAKAAIGENRHGVWIAGALEPGVSAEQVSRMLACRLSGDWAPHPEKAGMREFVAALLVPVPGFAMGRTAASTVRVLEGALVAATVPVRFADDIEEETVMEELAYAEGDTVRVVDDGTAGQVVAVHSGPMFAVQAVEGEPPRWHPAEELEAVDSGPPVEEEEAAVEELVASAVPDLQAVLDRVAKGIGRDRVSRMANLHARVHAAH